jgi:hypothetical protein
MELNGLFDVILVLAILAVAWIILRTILKLTLRLFRIGCLVILALVVLGWIAGYIG